MPLSESLLIALFTMSTVFVVLGILSVIVRLFSLLISFVEKRKEKTSSINNN